MNSAARLQAGAPPAGVLVGQETQAASARAITYEAIEPVHAKGKEAPMPAWLARAATSAPAERPVSTAPFIGREGEMELLERTWARTSGELHPQLVTLVGPPGIGKTRLALEFAARVESAGGRTLRGRPLAECHGRRAVGHRKERRVRPVLPEHEMRRRPGRLRHRWPENGSRLS